MAVYLPILTALLAGVGFSAGATTLAIALGAITVVLWSRSGSAALGRFVSSANEEVLLLRSSGCPAGRRARPAAAGLRRGRRVPRRHRPVRARRGQRPGLLTPLRDLFAAVFFVFFGLHTDPPRSRRCCCGASRWPS